MEECSSPERTGHHSPPHPPPPSPYCSPSSSGTLGGVLATPPPAAGALGATEEARYVSPHSQQISMAEFHRQTHHCTQQALRELKASPQYKQHVMKCHRCCSGAPSPAPLYNPTLLVPFPLAPSDTRPLTLYLPLCVCLKTGLPLWCLLTAVEVTGTVASSRQSARSVTDMPCTDRAQYAVATAGKCGRGTWTWYDTRLMVAIRKFSIGNINHWWMKLKTPTLYHVRLINSQIMFDVEQILPSLTISSHS